MDVIKLTVLISFTTHYGICHFKPIIEVGLVITYVNASTGYYCFLIHMIFWAVLYCIVLVVCDIAFDPVSVGRLWTLS